MHTRSDRRSGLALILVLMVLAALVAVATPFLVSMVQHESTSRNYLDNVKARIAAENARNAGVISMMRTHESFEIGKNAVTPFDDPEVDTLDEIIIDKADIGLPKDAVTLDPRGLMWDAHAEDEQGKINLRTAPRHVVENLLKIVDPKTSPLERYTTEWSNRPIEWLPPQRIRSLQTATLTGGQKATLPIVNDPPMAPLSYGPGTRVRVSDGKSSLIAYVVLDYEDDLALSVQIPTSMSQDYLYIQAEYRHPVNINTAPREVIAAVLMGLSVDMWKKNNSGGGMGIHFIDPEATQEEDESAMTSEERRVSKKEALALAERLVGKPYISVSEIADVIDDAFKAGIITKRDKAAILTNITNPSSLALKDTGTVPFCFRSHDVFSIEAIGVMNNPAGRQTASHTFREVLSIVPFGNFGWELKNQYDFTQMATLCGSSKTVVGPNFGVISTADWNATAQSAGDLRVQSPDDTRGDGISLTESFPGTYDGQELSGPMPYDFSDETIAAPAAGSDISAGGIEMWVKPSGFPGGRTYFFDFAQGEFENRISLYYDGSGLVLTATDATVDTWESQVRHTVQLLPDTWYHLGAYWKSTYYGHLCLMLDGKVVGTGAHVDQSGQRALAFLSSNTNDTDTSITVTSTANFPTPAVIGGIQRWGVIEIGSEAIEYSGMSGTTFTNCVRGARGTTPGSHVAGAAVTIYGYSDMLSTEGVTISSVDPSTGEPATLMSIDLTAGIPVVRGLLADSIGERPEATINKPAAPPEPGGILATDTTIPVLPNTDGFPSKGFIKIGGEVIYYDSKTSSSFEGCRRGAPQAEPTTASPHRDGARIVMFAIPITDVAGYPNPAIVQIDDEWMAGRPVVALEDGGGYLMGWIFVGVGASFARPPFRGDFFDTLQAAHSANVKVIPVFSVTDPECGKSDKVTIIAADQTVGKEQMEIRNAKPRRTISRDVGGMTVQITISNLVAFMDFTTRAYAPDDVNRLLKFPSGELASYVTDRIYVCGMSPSGTGSSSSIGGGGTGTGAKGTIDEIRFFSGPKGDFRLAQPLDTSTGGDIQMNAVTGIDANGGAVKIGDELIGFARAGGGIASFSGCKRGYLKTTASVHDQGDRAFNLSFLGITALSADVSAEAGSISLSGSSGLPAAGYLLVENEVIGYTHFTGTSNAAMAFMPMDMVQRGMYRGAYGTDAAGHAAGELAYAIPFRYWDRYSANSYDLSLVRFEATIPVVDALWKRIHWTEEHDSSDPNLDVHMRIRIDTCGEWEMAQSGVTPPKRAQIFSFNEPIGKNPLNVRGSRAELRCFWEYKKGSFATNSWKKTVFVGDIFVDYEAKTTTLSHKQMR